MFENLRTIFEIVLTVAFVISVVTYIIYRLTFVREIKANIAANRDNLANLPKKERKSLRHHLLAQVINTPYRKTVYFFADLFWVLLLVVVVRGFFFEPFVIPSGSMKPELQIRDIILVNKYSKGLRLPISNARLTQGDAIKRGDVIVFKYPENPKIAYIKRVIGLPGDKVYYDNRKKMTINGKPVTQTFTGKSEDTLTGNQGEITTKFSVYQADLFGKKFNIQYADHYPTQLLPREYIIPKHQYLVMGDNRDSSKDGRFFGYVDDALIIGQAKRILLNWGCLAGDGKCDRFFKKIQ
ncbi:MAG: signal peptidase I [Gammaproteobacteria bacterium]|nr:MAG: signal peptidase I [Gammaproteobacteria bacterium]